MLGVAHKGRADGLAIVGVAGLLQTQLPLQVAAPGIYGGYQLALSGAFIIVVHQRLGRISARGQSQDPLQPEDLPFGDLPNGLAVFVLDGIIDGLGRHNGLRHGNTAGDDIVSHQIHDPNDCTVLAALDLFTDALAVIGFPGNRAVTHLTVGVLAKGHSGAARQQDQRMVPARGHSHRVYKISVHLRRFLVAVLFFVHIAGSLYPYRHPVGKGSADLGVLRHLIQVGLLVCAAEGGVNPHAQLAVGVVTPAVYRAIRAQGQNMALPRRNADDMIQIDAPAGAGALQHLDRLGGDQRNGGLTLQNGVALAGVVLTPGGHIISVLDALQIGLVGSLIILVAPLDPAVGGHRQLPGFIKDFAAHIFGTFARPHRCHRLKGIIHDKAVREIGIAIHRGMVL